MTKMQTNATAARAELKELKFSSSASPEFLDKLAEFKVEGRAQRVILSALETMTSLSADSTPAAVGNAADRFLSYIEGAIENVAEPQDWPDCQGSPKTSKITAAKIATQLGETLNAFEADAKQHSLDPLDAYIQPDLMDLVDSLNIVAGRNP